MKTNLMITLVALLAVTTLSMNAIAQARAEVKPKTEVEKEKEKTKEGAKQEGRKDATRKGGGVSTLGAKAEISETSDIMKALREIERKVKNSADSKEFSQLLDSKGSDFKAQLRRISENSDMARAAQSVFDVAAKKADKIPASVINKMTQNLVNIFTLVLDKMELNKTTLDAEIDVNKISSLIESYSEHTDVLTTYSDWLELGSRLLSFKLVQFKNGTVKSLERSQVYLEQAIQKQIFNNKKAQLKKANPSMTDEQINKEADKFAKDIMDKLKKGNCA